MGICRRSAIVAAALMATVAVAPLAGVARAGEIADGAAAADDFLQQGKPAEALDAFDKATDAFWAASPLQLRTVLFADTVSGYGQYTPRADSIFHSRETAKVYAEPVGYAFAATGDTFSVTFTAGIEVHTPGGLVLAKAADFGRLKWEGRTRSRAVQVAIDVGLPELRPGEYRLLVTLTDDTSGKATTATLPFTIVE